MPNKPKKPCTEIGCPNLTTEKYCTDHKRPDHQRYDQYRENAAQRGYDNRWRKARKHYLRKHPLCIECQKQGVVASATVVDHIKPHRGDRKLFWDSNNWQSLCKMHHDMKTANEVNERKHDKG